MRYVSVEKEKEVEKFLTDYDIKIRFKSNGYAVWWHRVVATLVQCMYFLMYVFTLGRYEDDFNNYNTKFGRYFYLTDSHKPLDVQKYLTYLVIRHELVHVLQEEQLGRWEYWKRYLVKPFFTVWTYRSDMEMEAYTQELLVNYEERGQIPARTVDRIVGNFTGPSYLFMNTDEEAVREEFDEVIIGIKSGKITGLWPYKPKAFRGKIVNE